MTQEVGTYAVKDVRWLVRSRDVWLGVSITFVVLTCTFATLFGWSFHNWKQHEVCPEYHTNTIVVPVNLTDIDDAEALGKHDLFEYRGVRFANTDVEIDVTTCAGKYHQALVDAGHGMSLASLEDDDDTDGTNGAQRRRLRRVSFKNLWEKIESKSQAVVQKVQQQIVTARTNIKTQRSSDNSNDAPEAGATVVNIAKAAVESVVIVEAGCFTAKVAGMVILGKAVKNGVG